MGLLQASKIPLSRIAMEVRSGADHQGAARASPRPGPPPAAAWRRRQQGPQTTRERMLAAVARTAEANGMELKD